MKKYVCEPCGYEYDPEVGDPENGIAPGTSFEELPEDWVCPICGMGKEVFIRLKMSRKAAAYRGSLTLYSAVN